MNTVFDEVPLSPLGEFTLAEPLKDEQVSRLPPLFYHEDEALESELLVLKLVSHANPNHEVYLYEFDGINLFSAMLLSKGESPHVSFDLVTVAVSEQPAFRVVELFKPRTVHEVIIETEQNGFSVSVVEADSLLAEFGLNQA